MLATTNNETRARVEAIKARNEELKQAAEARKAEQKRLTKNLGNMGEELFRKLGDCSTVSTDKDGNPVYLRKPGLIWDVFHGDSYVDLYNVDSNKTDASQFQMAVFNALKAIVADSNNVGDQAELKAWMQVLSEDFEFGLKTAPAVKSSGISGDYATKRFLQNRYGT